MTGSARRFGRYRGPRRSWWPPPGRRRRSPSGVRRRCPPWRRRPSPPRRRRRRPPPRRRRPSPLWRRRPPPRRRRRSWRQRRRRRCRPKRGRERRWDRGQPARATHGKQPGTARGYKATDDQAADTGDDRGEPRAIGHPPHRLVGSGRQARGRGRARGFDVFRFSHGVLRASCTAEVPRFVLALPTLLRNAETQLKTWTRTPFAQLCFSDRAVTMARCTTAHPGCWWLRTPTRSARPW